MEKLFQESIDNLSAYIADSAEIIGDVTVGKNSSVWPGAVLRGDMHFIKLGNNVSVQDNAIMHGTVGKFSTTVGNNVSVGHNAIVHGCKVGDNCIIGMGAIILEGAEIGAADELALPEFNHYLKREVNTEAPAIAKKYGLFKIPIKKEYGGFEAGPLVSALAKQRLSQMGLGFGSLINVQVFLCSLTLQRWGTEAQKSSYLKPAIEGDKILAFGLTEPDAGSDPQSMKTTFEDSGSDYVINGSKYLITNGGIANAMILFAKSKGDGKISPFIIDTKSPGFSVSMHLSEKIGLFTSDTAMLEFRDMHVPKENVIGEPGKGMHVAYSALLNGRMGIASSCVGIIQGCLNAVTSRA